MSSQEVKLRRDSNTGEWVIDNGSGDIFKLALYMFAGFAAVMLWYYIRVMLRGLFDFINKITMFFLEQHLYLFVLGGGLLFFSICNSLVGRKPMVRIWPAALGGLAILFGYWGYQLVELPGKLTGQYVRSDHKARLTIKGDSIHIWSGKKHLSGRCEFLPCFSHTATKTRITGFPLTGTKSELFSMSIQDINGETIYRLEPEADSLLIHADDGKTIHYRRIKQ